MKPLHSITLFFAICLTLAPLTATASEPLEILFRPAFMELRLGAVTQRLMPGEFVEVETSKSSTLEIDISSHIPRTVEITARSSPASFVLLGTRANLAKDGKMKITMNEETKRLDIAWTQGEMESPPSGFDKPSLVAFFTKKEDTELRSLEFAGIRPFGYTDALEGRTPHDGSLPPLPRQYADQSSLPDLPDLPSYDERWGDSGPSRRFADSNRSDPELLPSLELPAPRSSGMESSQPIQPVVLSPAPPVSAEEAARRKSELAKKSPPQTSENSSLDDEDPEDDKGKIASSKPEESSGGPLLSPLPPPFPAAPTLPTSIASPRDTTSGEGSQPLVEVIKQQEQKQEELLGMIQDLTTRLEAFKSSRSVPAPPLQILTPEEASIITPYSPAFSVSTAAPQSTASDSPRVLSGENDTGVSDGQPREPAILPPQPSRQTTEDPEQDFDFKVEVIVSE